MDQQVGRHHLEFLDWLPSSVAGFEGAIRSDAIKRYGVVIVQREPSGYNREGNRDGPAAGLVQPGDIPYRGDHGGRSEPVARPGAQGDRPDDRPLRAPGPGAGASDPRPEAKRRQSQSTRNLGKPWRNANGFFWALCQDGDEVALYRFAGEGEFPQRLSLPRAKRFIWLQAKIVVDQLGKGPIRAIELVLGFLPGPLRLLRLTLLRVGFSRLPSTTASLTSQAQVGEFADDGERTNTTVSASRIRSLRRFFQASPPMLSSRSIVTPKPNPCRATRSWSAKSRSLRLYVTQST